MRIDKKKKKKQNRMGKRCIIGMVLALTLIMSVQIVRLHEKNSDYKQQEEELKAKLEEEQQRSEELQEQEAYVGSDEYVEDTARSRLGMSYEDEIIFKEQ